VSVTTDDILLTAGTVEIRATGKTPTVHIVAYSGGLMTVPGWGPVVIDLAGLDIPASQVGILADHDSTLKGIVGHGRAQVDGGRLVVAGTIAPSSDAARQIIELAKSGFSFQASVGVTPTEYERVRAGQTVEANGRAIQAPATGFLYVKAGALREVSIVAIAADRDTSVSIAASERDSMTTETTTTAEELREQAAAETERITAIRNVCGERFGDIEARAIRENWDPQRTELEVLRASRPTAEPSTCCGTRPGWFTNGTNRNRNNRPAATRPTANVRGTATPRCRSRGATSATCRRSPIPRGRSGRRRTSGTSANRTSR